MTSYRDQERVVLYWRAIELFSPQALPPLDARGHVEDVRPGEPMPWEAGSHLSRIPLGEGKVWRHEVFGGVYDIQQVVDTLVQEFGDDDPADQRGTVRGQSALFGCVVDADGLLVDESAVLSSCPWAIGRIGADQRPDDWLPGFDQDVLHFGSGLAELTGNNSGGGINLLAASMREAVPGAVQEGVKTAVTGALLAAGPLGAAGGAAAGSVAGSLTRTAMNRTGSAAPGSPAGDTGLQPLARLETHPLRGADLQQFTKELAKRLGVTRVLKPGNVRVKSYQLSATRADETPDSAFLNSFLADDLARVARALHRSDAGPGLTTYLTKSDNLSNEGRVDVRHQPGAVRSGCQPKRIPLGRWPASNDHSLILSQQFALNQIIGQLANDSGQQPSRLFAVNGPPGTGKTTMLRDLIAAIVVQRALRLAQLTSPHDAFTGNKPFTWATSTMRHTVVAPAAKLTGFEIVVASANNGAVENITTEIPGPRAIGPQWRQRITDLDYFTATAELTCGDGAWGLVAAKLGNRANRGEFVQRFWWGNTGLDRHDGMRDVLKTIDSREISWAAEVARFTEAVGKVQRLAAERQSAATVIERLSAARAERARAAEVFRRAEQTFRRRQERLSDAEASMANADAAEIRAEAAVAQHRKDRPGILISLSTKFQAGRDWHEKHRALLEEQQDAARRSRQAHDAVDQLRRELDDARAAGQRARTVVTGIDQQTPAWRQEAERAVTRWGIRVPIVPPANAATDADRAATREKVAPWADDEFVAARTELFLAALRLHKTFITAEAPTVRRNLNALMDLLAGRGPRPSAAAARAAWQTFFLMVPVVSSAFASIGRLFESFGRESLGWLLIDEAGQATPQQAVGAIWRARRTVVVGDPLQIEPVVTMPWGGQQALGRLYGVPEEWAPKRTSVQSIADRIARYGTWLSGSPAHGAGSDGVWVGTPLRVHRRCDRPIFSVCNQIAYDGLMVYGVPERRPFPGDNTWYDVRAPDARGHWIPAEGRMLRELLARLRAADISASDIRVISPFRQVVRGALDVHREVFPDSEVLPGQRENWVGTVHKMQGREADVVVLVLGSDPHKPAARRWAAERPNLLNVAASRARRRLYVIGDRREWGQLPYFDALADAWPVSRAV